LRGFLKQVLLVSLAQAVLVAASGCDGGATGAAELPTYPGAVLLKPGEDPVADTLARNMKQALAIYEQALGTDHPYTQIVRSNLKRLPTSPEE
jgi:hypothetical protein